MNRRSFLGSLVGGIATTAAVRTWPFRIYSFPPQVEVLSLNEMTERYIRPAVQRFVAMSLNGLIAVTPENNIVKPTPEEVAMYFKGPIPSRFINA